MPYEPRAARLVVGRDAVRAHPARHGEGAGVGGFALKQAAFDGHNLMRPRAEEAEDGLAPAADGENGLVPVPERRVGADYAVDGDVQPAHAAQGVVDLAPLELELRGVAHVHTGAAAAAPVYGALGRAPLRNGGEELLAPAVADALRDLDYAYPPGLARQSAADEHGAGGYVRDAEGLAREAVYFGRIYLVFLQRIHAAILSRPRGLCNCELAARACASCKPARFMIY